MGTSFRPGRWLSIIRSALSLALAIFMSIAGLEIGLVLINVPLRDLPVVDKRRSADASCLLGGCGNIV